MDLSVETIRHSAFIYCAGENQCLAATIKTLAVKMAWEGRFRHGRYIKMEGKE